MNKHREDRNLITFRLLKVGLGAVCLFVLYYLSHENYLFYHSIAEMGAVLVAWAIFTVTWNTRKIVTNKMVLYLGIAYLFIGGLDLLHAFSYKGMAILPGANVNQATQLWISARYMESLSLLVAPLFLVKRFPVVHVLAAYTFTFGALVFVIFKTSFFPDCFLGESGLTHFKVVSEYCIVALLIASLFFLHQRRHLLDGTVYRLLVAAIGCTIIAELLFTLYHDVYGLSNFAGHIFKLFSFYLLYKSLIKEGLSDPYNVLFREVADKEEVYRQMFEKNKAPKLIIDPQSGQVVDANNAACDYYGYTRQAMLNLTIYDINTLSADEITREMQDAYQERKSVFTFRHKLASKEVRDVDVYSGPIKWGSKTFLYSIVHDVTERNRVKEKAELYAKNLTSIFNATPNILLLVAESGRVEMVNHQGESILKKEKKELLGKLGGEVLECLHASEDGGCGKTPHCRDCPIHNSVMSTFSTRRSVEDMESVMTLLINEKEQVITFLISTTLLEMGNEDKVLLSLADVSSLRRAEKEIRFQAQILNHIQDQVIATDQNGDILYVNAATQNRFGSMKNGLLGKNVEMFDERSADNITPKEILELTLRQGAWRGEITNTDDNKIQRVMELRTKLMPFESGEAKTLICISTDITEKKKLEERVRQTEKMESIGNLAGGIAHDFNNILYPIIGMAEMLADDLDEQPSEQEMVREIHSAAERGANLVRQILAFSRQSQQRIIPLRLQDTIGEAVSLSRTLLPANITIVTDIDDRCGLVAADSTQIHQVVINLLTNAYQAIDHEHGKIEVTFAECSSTKRQMASPRGQISKYVCLSIADNGKGMSESVRGQVFEPYFTTKEQGKGTGLGLAVVYGIIKEYEGDIEVVSGPGKGSVFRIFLPLIEDDTGNDEKTISEETPVGNEHILFVDDEVPVVNLGHQMLERLGYRVTPCTSALDAISLLKKSPNQFDLIVTDMTMPTMTGLQLAREAGEIIPGIKIIICSGYSDYLESGIIKNNGIQSLLMKPVGRRDMALEVRRVLDQ